MLLSGTLDFHPTNTVVMCVLARACCVIHKQIVLVKVLENGLCLCLTYHTFYSSQLSFGARKKKKLEFHSACPLGKQLLRNACPGLLPARFNY